jgi:hypothetical protein
MDAGHDYCNEALEKINHFAVAERRLHADRLAFADFKAGDGFLGGANLGFLAGDGGQIPADIFEAFFFEIRLLRGATNAGVNNDLFDHIADVARCGYSLVWERWPWLIRCFALFADADLVVAVHAEGRFGSASCSSCRGA